jgi:hypothetical protein
MPSKLGRRGCISGYFFMQMSGSNVRVGWRDIARPTAFSAFSGDDRFDGR